VVSILRLVRTAALSSERSVLVPVPVVEPVAVSVVHVVDVVIVWLGLVTAPFSVLMVVVGMVAMLDLLDLPRLEGLGVLPHAGRDRRHRLLLGSGPYRFLSRAPSALVASTGHGDQTT
jgi:hypothetical protein